MKSKNTKKRAEKYAADLDLALACGTSTAQAVWDTTSGSWCIIVLINGKKPKHISEFMLEVEWTEN